MSVSRSDLRKYNVLVLPSAWEDLINRYWKKRYQKTEKLGQGWWYPYCLGRGCKFLADSSSGLSSVRKKKQYS
jgi:hypothetical protein